MEYLSYGLNYVWNGSFLSSAVDGGFEHETNYFNKQAAPLPHACLFFLSLFFFFFFYL